MSKKGILWPIKQTKVFIKGSQAAQRNTGWAGKADSRLSGNKVPKITVDGA